jgi:Kef-type K+ transport system membrane component KefB
MKKFRNLIFYVFIIGGFSAVMYWIVLLGEQLETGRNISSPESDKTQWQEFILSLLYNLQHPLAILLAQIVVIILVARLFGWIFQKIGQPSVIGEIIAGIVLGPSLIGSYFPEFSAALFPVESFSNLQFLSQIGLILFMFVIGMELDLKVLKNRAHDAVVISHASIIIPFALGMGLAYYIYESFAPESVKFSSFGLFIGIAMSITAFPVLARIVQERGLHKTKLGTMVITCAAADDITAWCLLAAVIAIVKAGSFLSSLYVIALAVLYVLTMIKVVRPFLKRVAELHTTQETLGKPIVAIFFVTLIMSAYATEVIGIHALFGAFMAGAIMPENVKFRNVFIEKVEDVALVLLLPLFFVYTGLRTQIGLLNDPYLWKVTGLIILVAVIGKFIGSALAAKYVGQDWKDSLIIGALMNTRGLMELVVLNIGYDLGVLGPEIFAMMVIMALVTTFMTGPAIDLVQWAFKKESQIVPLEVGEKTKFKILVSFGNPEAGKKLLRIANGLVNKQKGNAAITAMHLTASEEIHHYNIDQYELESFGPIRNEAIKLDQNFTPIFKPVADIDSEIIEFSNEGNFDLLLVGLSQSIYEGTILGKLFGFTTRIVNPDLFVNKLSGKEKMFETSPFESRTRILLSKTTIPVGIFMDKNLGQIGRIFLPLFSTDDGFLIDFAKKFIHNIGAQVVILDAEGKIKNEIEVKQKIRSIEQFAPNHIQLVQEKTIENEFIENFDLMLISLSGWKKLVENESPWLTNTPSVLIMKSI